MHPQPKPSPQKSKRRIRIVQLLQPLLPHPQPLFPNVLPPQKRRRMIIQMQELLHPPPNNPLELPHPQSLHPPQFVAAKSLILCSSKFIYNDIICMAA